MITNTLYCQLKAKEHDLLGYTTYVFENLENAPFGHKYLMLTRWPNWQCRNVDIGEIGYVTYQEVIAGKDTWWNGTKDVPFNYSNLIFIKFIKENKKDNSKDIIL